MKDKQYKLIVSPLTSFYAEQLAQNPANFTRQPEIIRILNQPVTPTKGE